MLRYDASKNGTLLSQTPRRTIDRLPNITKPEDLVDTFPVHAGFKGFKLYKAEPSCLEYCTRLAPHCVYWAMPAFWLEEPSYTNNGCEFFFHENTPKELIPRTHLLHPDPASNNRTVRWELPPSGTTKDDPKFQFFHGRPHKDIPAHRYIGCGWSTWYTLDFPCLSGDLDDKIFMSSNEFTVVGDSSSSSWESSSSSPSSLVGSAMSSHLVVKPSRNISISSPRGLPLCSVDIELADRSKGRWIRERQPNSTSTACPLGMKIDKEHSKNFDVIVHDPDRPHCWNREHLLPIGERCIELNCRFITRSSHYISSFKKSIWYGVWRQDSCDYLEFTNRQLQQCITDRKIASIESLGFSIAKFFRGYLKQRLSNLTLYDGEGGRSVMFSTMGMTHYCNSYNDDFRARVLKEMPPVEQNTTDHYIVTGPFASSEREIFVYADRIDEMNRIVQELLEPRGYKFLEFFDLTAAFTYASATQMDGVHIIGPPMKMILTKLFHYMCKDVVEGSII